MDDRIRAAERSGDRQRLLVEQYRAGKEITWQVGDRIIGKSRLYGFDGHTGYITEIMQSVVLVTFDTEVTSKVMSFTYTQIALGFDEFKPEGC